MSKTITCWDLKLKWVQNLYIYICYRTAWVRVLNVVLVGILLYFATIIRTFGVQRHSYREGSDLQLWTTWGGGGQLRQKKKKRGGDLQAFVNCQVSKSLGSWSFIERYYTWQLCTHKFSVGKLPSVVPQITVNWMLIAKWGCLTLSQRHPAWAYFDQWGYSN
jgi:hypothetical protein